MVVNRYTLNPIAVRELSAPPLRASQTSWPAERHPTSTPIGDSTGLHLARQQTRRIQGVAKTVADKVDAQYRQRAGDSGYHSQPGRLFQADRLLRDVHHVAPRSRQRQDAHVHGTAAVARNRPLNDRDRFVKMPTVIKAAPSETRAPGVEPAKAFLKARVQHVDAGDLGQQWTCRRCIFADGPRPV